MRPINRLPVRAPSQFFTTYGIRAPKSTHWTKATCGEVDCKNYLRGFKVIVPNESPQAYYIRHDKSRMYKEERTPTGAVEFTYPPGQRCFEEHTKRLDKAEIYIVKGGDHRGNPKGTQTRTHTRPELWVEDFAETQDKIIKVLEQRN